MKALLIMLSVLAASPLAQATSPKFCKTQAEYRQDHMRDWQALNRMTNAQAAAKTPEEAAQIASEISSMKDYIIEQINEAIGCESVTK